MKFSKLLILNEIYFNHLSNFLFLFFHKTALYMAVEKENPEIVELLLACKNIDVNMKSVLFYTY